MDKVKRKFKKLVRDPKLFFKDMKSNREQQIKKMLPIKHTGDYKYTVVSAVYNVSKYLDDYFKSLTTQTLNFKKHICLILVDDGSTDSSAEIIKKWQKKYPNNIQYIYKENGGQAAARNLGLEFVKTEWVTFIDPDDFVDVDYFKNTSNIISDNLDLQMVVANIKFYIESSGKIQDTHPLKYRFHQKVCEFSTLDMQNNMNLSAAASFFRFEHIKKYKLSFNSLVKPNFEDGKLIADYLLKVQYGNVFFANNVVYLYRKRESNDSTIDTSWQKIEKFSNVLKYGFIPMLNDYQTTLGYVPKHIQRTALYDMAWYIKYLMNRPERTHFLTEEQKQDFQGYIEQVFNYIDSNEILNFNLAGVWFLQKVGMLENFKKQKTPSQIVYVENIDREKKQVLLSFFVADADSLFSISLNEQEAIPSYIKNTVHTFNERSFVVEKRIWIPFSQEDELLKVSIDSRKSRISLKGKQYRDGIHIKDILVAFNYSSKYTPNGSWLFMDRDTQADDNAEHLYRYIMKNYPEQTCYFALSRDSHDWGRLKAEGFNLVKFGTRDFENKLKHSSKIISSHLDRHINNYFGDEYEYSKKFVFLQHGITQNDLSDWFNMKKNLQCVITATVPEYHSIADDNNAYRLTSKEVVLTGFPRHDNLLLNNKPDSKIIVIMPTWRRSILGNVIGDSGSRELNDQFMETSYAMHWYSLLHSQELKKLAKQYNYQIVFAPHANIVPYLPLFNLPEYIQIWSSKIANETMQNLFQKAKLMITDYSSVAFEMAILNKMVLYYQFDRDEMYQSGTHLVQRGYFDYDKHGFGPVVFNEESLLSSLKQILSKNGKLFEPYATRISSTFPFRNGGNCERVYQAIINLDKPEKGDNLHLLKDMITQAENHKAWGLAATRILRLLDSKKIKGKLYNEYEQRYLNALFQGKKLNQLLDYLSISKVKNKVYWQAKIDLQIGNTVKGIKYFAENSVGSIEDKLFALLTAAYCEQTDLVNLLHRSIEPKLTSEYYPLLQIAKKVSKKEYSNALTLIDSFLDKLSTTDKNIFKLELLASYICMGLNNLKLAHQYLVRYEEHCSNDPMCRIAIARLAKLRNNGEKLFIQTNYVFEDNLLRIPQDLVPAYLKELQRQGNTNAEDVLLMEFLKEYPESKPIVLYKAEKLYQEHKWQELVNLLESCTKISKRATYLYVLALCRLKKNAQSQTAFKSIKNDNSFEYWKLAAEIAELNKDKSMLRFCLENQLSSLK